MAGAAVVPHSQHFAVTPWRLELANKAREIIRFIEEHAEPEVRFRAASDVSQDIVHAVKTSLRQQYGRVFDPLIDGPEPKKATAA